METRQYLAAIKSACDLELKDIANWWLAFALDDATGGLHGSVRSDGSAVLDAPVGSMLVCRTLWFFSTAAYFRQNGTYRLAADRLFDYFIATCIDTQYGGVYWELLPDAGQYNTKKQLSAQACALYALSSYYRLSGNKSALETAEFLFTLIETKGRDTEHGGYFTSFNRDWTWGDAVTSGDSDTASSKTAHTHVYILEAFTEFFSVTGHVDVRNGLRHCLDCFSDRIIDQDTLRVRTIMSADWTDRSVSATYGRAAQISHAAWKAALAVNDELLMESWKERSVRLVDSCIRDASGLFGELFDTYMFDSGTLITERLWWPQAEAMNGYLNAYQLTGNTVYLESFIRVWHFIQLYQKDRVEGEWFRNSTLDETGSFDHYKAAGQKTPYHSGRAMIEAVTRLQDLIAGEESSDS
ncbi:MAG: AGE family epimerase/isomerase [Spirochaetota bacterium]